MVAYWWPTGGPLVVRPTGDGGGVGGPSVLEPIGGGGVGPLVVVQVAITDSNMGAHRPPIARSCTLNCTLHAAHCAVAHCTLPTTHCTLNTGHCAIGHYTLHAARCTLHTVLLYIAHCAMHTILYTLHTTRHGHFVSIATKHSRVEDATK